MDLPPRTTFSKKFEIILKKEIKSGE